MKLLHDDGNSFPHSMTQGQSAICYLSKKLCGGKNSLLYLSMPRFVHYPNVLLKSQIPRQNLAKLSFVAKVTLWLNFSFSSSSVFPPTKLNLRVQEVGPLPVRAAGSQPL